MLASLFRSRMVLPMSYGCVGRSIRSASTARARGLETFRATRGRIYCDKYTRKTTSKYLKSFAPTRSQRLRQRGPGLLGRREPRLTEPLGPVQERPLRLRRALHRRLRRLDRGTSGNAALEALQQP